MSVNIQTANGLVRVSNEKLTKEKIIKYLGYTPADEQLLPNIKEDDSGNLYIADENGNVIFRVDSNGAHSVEFNIDGVPVGSHIKNDEIHITSEERALWNDKDYNNLNNKPMEEDGAGDLKIIDENGNIIFKIDNDGVHSIEFDADGALLGEHVANDEIHITQEERALWNDKDYNNLNNRPMEEDESGDLKIIDENGNIIFKVDDEGIHSINMTVNGVDVATQEFVNEKVADVHTHNNKDVLDNITAEDIAEWAGKSSFSGDYNDLENKPCYIEENAEVIDSVELVTERNSYMAVVIDTAEKLYGDAIHGSESGEYMVGLGSSFESFMLKVVDKYIPKENLIGKTYKDFTKSVSNTFTEDMVITDFSVMGIPEGTFPEGTYIIMSGLDEYGIPVGLYGIPEGAQNGCELVLGTALTPGLWYLTTRVITDGSEDIAASFPFGYFEYSNIRDFYHTLDERFIPDTIVRQDDFEEVLKNKSDRGHHHNDMYYEQDEIDDMITTINTALDGKAAKEHGTHLEFGSELPEPHSTNAYAGNSEYASRADHRHPSQTSITGNAGTASKLKNGIVFTIGDEAIVFDGSEPITFSLDNMGAAADSHSHEPLSYEEIINAPDILEDESGDLNFVDEAGNIILNVDSNGVHTTNVVADDSISATNANINNISTNSLEVDGVNILNTMDSKVSAKFAELVDSAPETLNTLNELAQALGDDPNFATTVSNQIGLKADKTYVDNAIANHEPLYPVPGNWFNGGHVIIGTDGVTEIGKYIDFHEASNTTDDFTTRIVCNASATLDPNTLLLPSKSGELALKSDIENILANMPSDTELITTEMIDQAFADAGL